MIIDTGRQYIMSDSNRNYSISDVINNNNLIEEYIKETFIGSQQHEFCNGNHSNYYCGIFTNDSCKADEIMNKIYKDNKDNIIRFVKGENDKYILEIYYKSEVDNLILNLGFKTFTQQDVNHINVQWIFNNKENLI